MDINQEIQQLKQRLAELEIAKGKKHHIAATGQLANRMAAIYRDTVGELRKVVEQEGLYLFFKPNMHFGEGYCVTVAVFMEDPIIYSRFHQMVRHCRPVFVRLYPKALGESGIAQALEWDYVSLMNMVSQFGEMWRELNLIERSSKRELDGLVYHGEITPQAATDYVGEWPPKKVEASQ